MRKLLMAAMAAGLMAPAISGAAKAPKGAASQKVTVELMPEQATDTISRMLYGQFAEHLGGCVYGGIWVGEDSPIPNTRGYRNDALQAIRDLEIPVLRWPGGCFADDYHWRDGIGPRDQRPTLINNNWGGTKEDNSFGTHEFLDLCELTGVEPYVSGNMGSGTVSEMAQWMEYMTSPTGPLADQRHANGREEPWKVKYFGIGNESWGCGGSMTPEYYSDNYRRYSTYVRNQPDNKLYRIASGASDYDYNWTKVLMDKIGPGRMDGLSLHYYTVTGWSGSKGSATKFDDDKYYWTLAKAVEIDSVISLHSAIMDLRDPEKKTGLLVDEWGTWFDEEPGSTPGHLYQQNTMRDAMVAALTLNIFHNHADRVKMANIAQLANVLQSMWLTKDDKMVLTPSYFVFKLYKPHKDAVNIPLKVNAPFKTVSDGRKMPTLSVTASKASDGSVTVSLVNPMIGTPQTVEIPLKELPSKISGAEILTAGDVHAHNTFENPDAVKLASFKGAEVKKGVLVVEMPPVSVVSVTLK